MGAWSEMTDRDLWTESAEDLYGSLGVPASATSEQIRRAWHEQARASHPDLGGELGRFRSVHIAYLVLSDPEQRARYDRHRLALRPPAPPVRSQAPRLRVPTPPPDLNTSQEAQHSPWLVWLFVLLGIAAVGMAAIWPASSIVTGTVVITVVVTRYVLHARAGHPSH